MDASPQSLYIIFSSVLGTFPTDDAHWSVFGWSIGRPLEDLWHCLCGTLCPWHSVPVALCLRGTLSPWHSIPVALCLRGTLSLWHSVPMALCPRGTLSLRCSSFPPLSPHLSPLSHLPCKLQPRGIANSSADYCRLPVHAECLHRSLQATSAGNPPSLFVLKKPLLLFLDHQTASTLDPHSNVHVFLHLPSTGYIMPLW